MKKLIAPLVWLALFTGCIEDYDLEFDEVPPRLVVEGLITNEPGPYFIRLSESFTGKLRIYFDGSYHYDDTLSVVTDALVIVSDNAGQVDTLTVVKAGDYKSGGYHQIIDSGYSIDTIWRQQNLENFTGFYKTGSLVGVPGRIYSLKVVHRDKIYEAHAYMPPVPDIDSLGIAKVIGDIGKGDYYMPLLYFAEPQETTDYYLVQLVDEATARGGGFTYYDNTGYWPFSVLSDEYLQPYVNGLPLSGGTNKLDYDYWPAYAHGDMYVRLNSLTKEAYQYYKVLTEQFENDGGIFQPAPASAPTNISSGGLGFFRASAVAVKHRIIDGQGMFVEKDDVKPLEVSTLEVTEITATTAVSSMEVFNAYGLYGSLFGICWSTEPNPTIDDFYLFGVRDDISICKMTNLVPGTRYYVRGFVKTRQGTVFYGNQREFTTLTE